MTCVHRAPLFIHWDAGETGEGELTRIEAQAGCLMLFWVQTSCPVPTHAQGVWAGQTQKEEEHMSSISPRVCAEREGDVSAGVR